MIRPKFTSVDVHQMMKKKIDQFGKDAIVYLTKLGEECVRQAVESGSYTDQSGHLRSSIGYLIVDHGKIVQVSFNGDIKEALSESENYGKVLAGKYGDCFALIVVAGKNYAAYVESRGFDVLSGAENYARARAPQITEQLKSKINNLK